MRKIKIGILTVLAIASLFSLRDKEVVITVPDTKPLIAEAYHLPDAAQQNSYPDISPQLQNNQQPKPLVSSGSAGSQDTAITPYYSSSSEQTTPPQDYVAPIVQTPPVQPAAPVAPTTNTNNQPANNMYYALGGYIPPPDPNADKTPELQPSPTGSGNTAPVIDSFVPSSTSPSVSEDGSLVFSVTVHDPEGNLLTCKWLFDGVVSSEQVPGSETPIIFTYPYNPAAGSAGTTHTIKASVSDGSLSTDQSWTVTVKSARGSSQVHISRVIPENGAQGKDVVIQGKGFSTTASQNTIKFGTILSGAVTAVSTNQLHATVPAGLSAGFTYVSVTVNGEKSNDALFDVLANTPGNVFLDKTNNSLLLPSDVVLDDSSIVRTCDLDNDKYIDMVIEIARKVSMGLASRWDPTSTLLQVLERDLNDRPRLASVFLAHTLNLHLPEPSVKNKK